MPVIGKSWLTTKTFDFFRSEDGLGGRLIKALTDISTPDFSNTGRLEETPHYDSTMDDDADDDDNGDEDVDGEHDGKYR